MSKSAEIVTFIKQLYPGREKIALHEPCFIGNEKKYLAECIDSTFVSYVGAFVNQFEEKVKKYTGAKYAIATANGTLALHTALLVCGVQPDDEVIVPALTFVATANAITYTGARCVFIDSERDTLGMCPEKLEDFLAKQTVLKADGAYNKTTGRRIRACVPVHIFGHPAQITSLKKICDKYQIVLVEDAAESLGSFYEKKHTGTFGRVGILSFNGNKVITTGGGGMLLTDDEKLAQQAKHLTTTAKLPHAYEFVHDQVGFNYRMPNVNAALGCAQMENLENYLQDKRELTGLYQKYFKKLDIEFVTEPKKCVSNYWLNVVMFKNSAEKEEFLKYSNQNNVLTRPVWRLMDQLPMYKNCQKTDLTNAEYIQDRLVNIPSSARLSK